MIRGLLEKEFRQHATLLIFMLLLMAAGLVALLSSRFLGNTGGSSFSQLAQLWFYILPLAALVLASGLIATEFRHRTQLFLEGLPMPRWLMLTVKYLLGLGILLSCVCAMLAAAWWKGRDAEAMTLNFSLLLCVKSVAWAWFCWAVCFAHGFLGRYRGWVGTMLVLGLVILQQTAGVMVTRFGPFELISDRFAYERFVWPVEALRITVALILVVTAAGFALGLVRDATVAGMMSEKMSMREKVIFTIIPLAALFAIGIYQNEKDGRKQLALPGSVDFQQGAATVAAAAAVVTPTAEEERALEAHGRAVSEMLDEAGTYLKCKSLPPVYLIHRRDFSAGITEVDTPDSPKHVLIRSNLLTSQPGDAALNSKILRGLLTSHQHDRLSSDTRGWVLDGFAVWWPIRNLAKNPAEFLKLRAHQGDLPRRTVRRVDLEQWLKTKQSLTPDQQETLAGLGMIVLGENGEEPRQRFLSTVLGYSAPKDARASLHDWLHPIDRILKSATGGNLESLAEKRTNALQSEEKTR